MELLLPEAATGGVLYKKTTVLESIFNKIAKAWNVIKKKL